MDLQRVIMVGRQLKILTLAIISSLLVIPADAQSDDILDFLPAILNASKQKPSEPRVVTLNTTLTKPWGLAFLLDGRILCHRSFLGENYTQKWDILTKFIASNAVYSVKCHRRWFPPKFVVRATVEPSSKVSRRRSKDYLDLRPNSKV